MAMSRDARPVAVALPPEIADALRLAMQVLQWRDEAAKRLAGRLGMRAARWVAARLPAWAARKAAGR